MTAKNSSDCQMGSVNCRAAASAMHETFCAISRWMHEANNDPLFELALHINSLDEYLNKMLRNGADSDKPLATILAHHTKTSPSFWLDGDSDEIYMARKEVVTTWAERVALLRSYSALTDWLVKEGLAANQFANE